MDDLISRQAAIDAILHNQEVYSNNFGDDPIDKYTIAIIDNDAQTIAQLPSAQPDAIPLEWIDKHLEWLDNCDNDFAQLAKVSIKAMVEIWKKNKISMDGEKSEND